MLLHVPPCNRVDALIERRRKDWSVECVERIHENLQADHNRQSYIYQRTLT